MRRVGAAAVVSILLAAGTAFAGETVISETKQTGATLRSSYVNSGTMFVSVTQSPTGVFVVWGGATGIIFGQAPESAVRVVGNSVRVNLDAASLINAWSPFGPPDPCVGTISAAATNYTTFFDASESTGKSSSSTFMPFPFSGGYGMLMESTTNGHVLRTTARFTGTCAGADVPESNTNQVGSIDLLHGTVTMRQVYVTP